LKVLKLTCPKNLCFVLVALSFSALPASSAPTQEKIKTTAQPRRPNQATFLTLEKEIQSAENALSYEKRVLDPDDKALSACKLWLARLYVESGQNANALPILFQLIDKNKQDFGTHSIQFATTALALAQAYEGSGKLKEAQEQYQQALGILEAKHDLLFEKTLQQYAKLLYKLSETSEAQNCFKRIKELQGGDKAYSVKLQIETNNKAVTALGVHKYEEAIELLENLLIYHPSYRLALDNLKIAYDCQAQVLLKKNDFEGAEQFFKKSIDSFRVGRGTEDQQMASLGNLSYLLMKMKRYSDVIDYATRIVSLNADSYLGHYYRGKALEATGRYEAAIEDFSECIKKNAQKKSCPYIHRAKCYEKLGRQALAKEDMRQVKTPCNDDNE